MKVTFNVNFKNENKNEHNFGKVVDSQPQFNRRNVFWNQYN